MARNYNFFELVDKYLNGELEGEMLAQFNEELKTNEELAKEIRLQTEVAESIVEQDVMDLRNSLKQLREGDAAFEEEVAFEEEYSFGLSEEVSYIEETSSNFADFEIEGVDNSLHKLHLDQHKKAENEVVHEVYRKNYGVENETETGMLSDEDEALLDEVSMAIKEKDVIDLRASLEHIASNMPTHQFESQEIEDYIDGLMDADQMAAFENELQENIGLSDDVELHTEVNEAIAEADIMNLRASLQDIRVADNATSRTSEEIEAYIDNDLSSEEMHSFEEELSFNMELVDELELHKEINEAIAETDVQELRAQLQQIRTVEEKQKETRSVGGVTRSIKKTWSVAAACMVLMLGVAGVLRVTQQPAQNELFASYHSKYEISGTRSGNAATDMAFKLALHNYNQAQYSEAANQFEELLTIDSDVSVNFYAGLSYQEMEDYKNAIRHFLSVVDDDDNLFIEQAQWYLGLCYLQTDDKRKAIEQFEWVATRGKSHLRKKAKKIVRVLR
jgi:TolA-binding protein